MQRTSEQLEIRRGGPLGKSHQVMDFLGQGGFGLVTKCFNTVTGTEVAIKVNKNHPKISQQARHEVAMLKRLRCLDPDTSNIVKWNGFFFHKDQICLNFELLDKSLHDYRMHRRTKNLPMRELKPVIHQLATALSHLSSEGIVHADLKPENVMVVDSNQHPLRVKLIDFGLAHPRFDVKDDAFVQTTWYRAPEVMLQLPFDEAIDMWSLGLTIVEMATGYAMYPGDSDYDVLRFIVETQGQPPDHVLDSARGTDFYFRRQNNGEQRWRLKTPMEFYNDTGYRSIDTRSFVLPCLDSLEQLMMAETEHQSDKRLLVDLIKRMLELDPVQRIKPLEVLQHPFFTHSRPQSSVCIQIPDPEESSVSQAGPENLHCRLQMPSVSLTDSDESEDSSKTNAKNKSWLWRLVGKVTDTFSCFLGGR